MQIKIKNKEIMCVINFLRNIVAKGKTSLARSQAIVLLERKEKEFTEDRKLIIEEHAEKDSDGKPITNDDGTYKLTAEGNKEAGKTITELFEEEAVIQYGEYTSKLNDLEKFLDEYDGDVSGDDAQGFFALVTAFENKEDK
ncbi:DUF1617 family protein [Enterococcus casseliflavus]|uniref:DUF1617 family protein n=1 Tax=Enterococcus casseliflavus TaxID=37734 RepID=UPI003D0F0CD3